MKGAILKVLFVEFCLLLSSCTLTPSIEDQMQFAENKFKEEVSFMSERDALSKEIDYYKAPQITERVHLRSLTGKDLIHECNVIIEEDNNKDFIQLGPTSIKYVRKVDDIKEYALNHPNEIIANEFKFTGIFTHYGDSKYCEEKAQIIVVAELERYILNRIY